MSRQAVVQTECPTCGPLNLSSASFRCGIDPKSPGLAICEYICPSCSSIVLFPALPQAAEALMAYGAGRSSGTVPFEVLEPHSGPTLTADDLLDFGLALQHMETLPQELQTEMRDLSKVDP